MTHTARPRRTPLAKRVAISTFAVLILYVGYQVFKILNQDPDDRPPIIVNQGSLIFEVQARNGERGKWKKDLLGGKWHVRHPLKPPTYLEVGNFKGSSCTGPYQGSAVTVNYGSATLQIEVSGTNAPPLGLTKHIKIDFQGAQPTLTNDYTLTLDTATLNSINITLTNGGSQSCTFDGSPREFSVDHRK